MYSGASPSATKSQQLSNVFSPTQLYMKTLLRVCSASGLSLSSMATPSASAQSFGM